MPQQMPRNSSAIDARISGIGVPAELALALWKRWQEARYVSLLLCRVQQRLESRMEVNTGIPGLTENVLPKRPPQMQSDDSHKLGYPEAYSVAREAEVFAMTEALRLQDAIPEVAANSLAGVIAKLEMIVGADRDIGDPTDFPWPHIASVLRDLKAIGGTITALRPDRTTTRADAMRYWKQAGNLIAALRQEDEFEESGNQV